MNIVTMRLGMSISYPLRLFGLQLAIVQVTEERLGDDGWIRRKLVGKPLWALTRRAAAA